MMLALEVEKDELLRRILHRGENSGRSDDTNLDIINKRIDEYNNKTAPLKEYYSKQNKLHIIKGVGGIEAIFRKLCEAIDLN